MASFLDFDYFERQIQKTYGDKVTFVGKAKTLAKFGINRDLDVGIEETIMDLFGTETEETYVNDNLIDTVVTDNAGNTQEVTIEGHTIDINNELTFVTQQATLTGLTPVALSTPLARSTRIFINDGQPDLAASSTVYVYEDSSTVTSGVPDDKSKIHVSMNDEYNQSNKAASSVSKDDYYLITGLTIGIERTNASGVDFRLYVRTRGSNGLYGPFRSIVELPLSNTNSPFEDALTVPIIVPPNSDFKITGVSQGNNTKATARVAGFLARKYF